VCRTLLPPRVLSTVRPSTFGSSKSRTITSYAPPPPPAPPSTRPRVQRASSPLPAASTGEPRFSNPCTSASRSAENLQRPYAHGDMLDPSHRMQDRRWCRKWCRDLVGRRASPCQQSNACTDWRKLALSRIPYNVFIPNNPFGSVLWRIYTVISTQITPFCCAPSPPLTRTCQGRNFLSPPQKTDKKEVPSSTALR